MFAYDFFTLTGSFHYLNQSSAILRLDSPLTPNSSFFSVPVHEPGSKGGGPDFRPGGVTSTNQPTNQPLPPLSAEPLWCGLFPTTDCKRVLAARPPRHSKSICWPEPGPVALFRESLVLPFPNPQMLGGSSERDSALKSADGEASMTVASGHPSELYYSYYSYSYYFRPYFVFVL